MAEVGDVEMTGMDTPGVNWLSSYPVSMEENIGSGRRATSNGTRRTNLTMTGHSGHAWYKKAGQTTWWISYTITGLFVLGAGNFFTASMRVDAKYIWEKQGLLGFIFAPFWPILAPFIVDAEIGQSIMNVCGLSRRKCGRRVPYFVISNALVLVLGFFTWRPSRWANMAKEIQPDRLLKKYNFSNYQYYGEDIKPWPSDGLMTANGFDCSKKLRVFNKDNRTDPLVFNFNVTRNTGEANEVPMYGTDMCAALVSNRSVCWPGPTGAEIEGDGGKRVCAYMAHEELANHWFIMSFMFVLFSFPGISAAAATTVEVYPWKEERMQLKSYSPWIGGVSFTLYLIMNAYVTSSNEHTTRPNG